MIDRATLYTIMYALAARDGRESKLFGTCLPLAEHAFAHSLVGEAFPEIWFELPLKGDPWFDLHVLAARSDLDPGALYLDELQTYHPALFEWFAKQPRSVRQLALSHDLSAGVADNPAAQLLMSCNDHPVMCSFLEKAGGPDAAQAFRGFVDRLPEGWFACYAGVFPGRPDMGLRVECIPDNELQRAYAHDAALLEEHLRCCGFDALGDTVIPRCQQLSQTPFHIEFQFDVENDGTPSDTFSASVRFAIPPGSDQYQPFTADGAGGELMKLVESWDLADDRWRLFEDASFSKRATLKDQATLIYNFPAFLKLRWKKGMPFDAKAYFIAGMELCEKQASA